MATVDLTEAMRAMPVPIKVIRYRRITSKDWVPAIDLQVYVNSRDPNDVYISAQSACVVLGLNRRWLSVAEGRASTMERLASCGFSDQKTMLNVTVENSPTGLAKPSRGLTQADFDALMEYAASIGKKPALILRNAFFAFGLVTIAGLSTPETRRECFRVCLEQSRRELEAG